MISSIVRRQAFSLVELLVVMAIVAMLLTISMPEFNKTLDRARSTACAANLRQIGVATLLYVGENNSTYPIIETNPANPVYPEEIEARSMLETLGDYGLDAAALRCPSDLGGPNNFAKFGSSYDWRPIVDDENSLNPIIYTRRGARRVSPKRIRLVTDYEAVHNGRMNRLFADGRVQKF